MLRALPALFVPERIPRQERGLWDECADGIVKGLCSAPESNPELYP